MYSLFAVFVCLATAQTDTTRFEHSFPAMGVRFQVIAYAESRDQFEKAAGAVEQRVGKIEKSLSDYDPDSEINRIARTAPHATPVQISDILWSVSQAASRIFARSGGAFDPSIGAVSKIWRMARKRNRLPDDEKISRAMKSTGWNKVQFSSDRTIRLTSGAMQLDFGGIAKGYAADQAIDICREHGISSALIDAGGDIRAADAPPAEKGWLIAIDNQPASEKRNSPRRFLVVANKGVATSSDARQRLIKDGQTYSHIIDPRSGRAIINSCAVTVIANDATTADGVASAISVLGGERGIEFANELTDVEALIVCPRDGQKSKRLLTAGFTDYSAD